MVLIYLLPRFQWQYQRSQHYYQMRKPLLLCLCKTLFLIFHTSRGISSRPAASLLLIFPVLHQVLSSETILVWCLISYYNIFDRFIRDFMKVSKQILKMFFHFWSLSCWLAAFSFALMGLFLQLTLFTVMLILIVYLLLNFWFYWFSLKWILIVLFNMFYLVHSGLSLFIVHCQLSFFH